MSILPKISSVDVFTINENQNNYTYINLNKDNNNWITFKDTDKSNKYILQDLIENKAYATMLLYLNENYILQVGITNDIFKNSNGSVKDYLNECDEMLHNNISIVEEAGIPLCDINGYKIFEGAGYILRGNGKKKIKESFTNINEDNELDLFPSYKNKVLELIKEKKNKWDIYDFIDGAVSAYSISKDEAKELKNLVDNKNININEDGEGTQSTDIAPKIDQDMNKRTTNKKKYYDILLSNISESDNMNIINKGFLKNSKGQYQRGNYILVKEGETYLAIHKNKIK